MISDNSFLKSADTYKEKEDFLMSPSELDSLRFGAKTPDKLVLLDKLNNKIDEIVSNYKPEIFEKIKESRQKKEINNDDINGDEIKKAISIAGPNAKLQDLPTDIFAKILRPMNTEARQMIYVQRNKISADKAWELFQHWSKEVVTVFHVSDRELSGDELRAGDKDTAVYFSTDIKRLFNLKDAKYIYAFRISKKTSDISAYGALDCFGKLNLKKGQGIEVEDKIKIFSETNPSYRSEVLNSLGASFDESYQPAKDSTTHFMKAKQDDDNAYSLRA
ncbi:hypothetical protein JXK06_02500 [Patescibacteria group bacterium]|nr:hypothetical protein [Patescibacteria group bacterium]